MIILNIDIIMNKIYIVMILFEYKIIHTSIYIFITADLNIKSGELLFLIQLWCEMIIFLIQCSINKIENAEYAYSS